jgi:hypothetical protein
MRSDSLLWANLEQQVIESAQEKSTLSLREVPSAVVGGYYVPSFTEL